LKVGEDIIDPSKLTEFVVTISKLELRNDKGEVIDALESEINVDLRNYQGTVKELPSVNVPLGNYTGLIIYFSGVSTTYDGNNYTASITSEPSVTINGVTTGTGVPNAFENEIGVDITIDYEVSQESSPVFNITFDAVASCYEIEFDCPACTPSTQYFAGLRPIIEKHMSLYFEEGIQQIKYSPPLNIEYSGGSTANYSGVHTFKDFNGIGGNITSHASQHVYRGTDGGLSLEIGAMVNNGTPLTPSTINATGTTDVTAEEVFDFAFINTELISKGYTLQAGSTYYFSLKKTWTITSGLTKYTITRMCEPVPVIWPAL
jgi:hypothetical protein